MKRPKFKKYKFVFDYIQTRDQYPFYDHYENTINAEPIPNHTPLDIGNLKDTIHIVNYIPPFLKPQFRDEFTEQYNFIPFEEFHGFMADFKGFSSFEKYLLKEISSKRRKNIRSSVRKLETCFNISYTRYLGEISKERYDFLLDKTRSFLSRRFEQRGDTHELLENWDFIERTTFDLIHARQASLFVIYRNQDPISICLNYHLENVLHNAIGAFDIDYFKFSLGSIEIYKQMEWCVANNIRIFDLGLGDMEYKSWWCNIKYTFDHQVLYERNSSLQKGMAHAYVNLFKLKQYLKKRNVDRLYHSLKNLVKNKAEETSNFDEFIFEQTELDSRPAPGNTRLLDIMQPDFAHLRRPVYDFQFQHSEAATDITVHGEITKKDVYYVIGKNNIMELRLLT